MRFSRKRAARRRRSASRAALIANDRSCIIKRLSIEIVIIVLLECESRQVRLGGDACPFGRESIRRRFSAIMKIEKEEVSAMLTKIEETTVTIKLPYPTPFGDIVALDVSEEDYTEHLAEDFYEWVEGVVYKMSPVTGKHDKLSRY